jgi:acid phosphatase type 7
MRRLPEIVTALLLVFVGRSAMADGIAKGPYLMHPTTAGVTVCWVSDEPETGEVRIEGQSEPLVEVVSNRIHRVKVEGLKPYTLYDYEVRCAGDKKKGSFRTAAPPGQPFAFVAYGDNRTQPKKHRAVLDRMSRFHPDFIIQTGDQVADGSNEAQWDEFWDVASKALRRAPYFPSLGNHEKGGAPYFRFFDVPAEYSFDYGDAHFVCLNTNRPAREYRAQEAWLRKDLAAHQSARWRIVYFHHTVHTCVAIPSRRVAAALLAKRLEPIFEAEHVQLVINGHDHDYQRHEAHGITYLVTGGGGAPLYDVKPNTPFVKKAKKAYHYCELLVKGDGIDVRAVEPSGKVIDEFQVHP